MTKEKTPQGPLDVARALGLVTRSLNEQRQGERVVVASRSYDTAMADVWDALTNPERIPRWFLPITGELRVGGRYQLQGNAGGEILRCAPPAELRISWEFNGDVSFVEVRLTALAPEQTRLELQHGRSTAPNEHWDKFGPGATGVGWDLTLYGLGLNLASGESNDPASSMAWLGSEEGKAFCRTSSEAWGQAHIASGTEPSVALAAAARTAAAYTGEAPPDAPAPS
jgi:uncharacterized protein YndB with AHSA1/START domain